MPLKIPHGFDLYLFEKKKHKRAYKPSMDENNGKIKLPHKIIHNVETVKIKQIKY